MHSAYINLLKTAVCSGILTYPSLAAALGWGGLFLCAFIASIFSVVGLCLHAISQDDPSFLQKGLSACVILKSGGVATAYALIAGSLLEKTFPIGLSQGFWSLVFICCCSPLCFLRSLSNMKCSSLLGLLCVCFLIVFTLSTLIARETWFMPPFSAGTIKDYGKYAGTFVFSFACHQNIRTVVQEFGGPSKVMEIGFYVISTAFFAYTLFGVTGFALFGPGVQENALDSFGTNAIVLKLAYACVLAVSFPLQVHPVRSHIFRLLLSSKKHGLVQRKPVTSVIDPSNGSNFEKPARDAENHSQGSTSTRHISAKSRAQELLCVDKSEITDTDNHVQGKDEINNPETAVLNNTINSERVFQKFDDRHRHSNNLGIHNPLDERAPISDQLSNSYKIEEDKLNSKEDFEISRVNGLAHAVLTILILTAIYGLSISGISLGTMYSLIGSTVSATVCNILPGFLYLTSKHKKKRYWKSLSIASIIYGAGIVATTSMVFMT